MAAPARRFTLCAALLLHSTAAAPLAASTIDVTGVHTWSFPGRTRAVIDASGPFRFQTSRLHNPERLVVDIPASRTWISHRRFTTQHVGDALLQSVRIAESEPGNTRVVFDLTGDVSFIVTRLESPNRLLVEIEPSTPGSETAATRPPPPVRLPKPVPAVTGNSTSSLTRALGLKVHRIAIDPGHGGKDEGTQSPHGLREKDVVLDVAVRLAKLIRDRTDIEVVMTRADDTFIPLQERTAIANARLADLFISIHANSSRNVSSSGAETYYLNFTDSKAALDLAARENVASGQSVSDLPHLVHEITANDKTTESQELARVVEKSISAQTAGDRGVKRAPFVVLIGASMPSVLAEIGFLSNTRDEASLGTPACRQKMAEALFRGIMQYSEALNGARPTTEKRAP